jgi:hypothetical protein
MINTSSIRLALGMVPLFSMLLGAEAARAQWPSRFEHPELYVQLGDSIWICRVHNSGRDTVDAEDIVQNYVFQMLNDSTSLTEYRFGETRRNGHRIPLDKWDLNSRRTTAAAVLSYNSRTVPFVIHGGDSLSFYRELYWYNPLFNRQLSNEYYSRDTLTYAVELVEPSTETRLALLDSIGIMPNLTPATPIVHGARPIMAKVNYVVPARLDGDTAIMRVVLRNRGDGDYWFDRQDKIQIGMSRQLSVPEWQHYLSAWGLLLNPPELGKSELERTTSSSDSVILNVAIVPGTHDAHITFSTAPNGATTSVVVYDARGRSLFDPYSSRATTTTADAFYHFEQSGLYIIGLIHDGGLVRTQKITITK